MPEFTCPACHAEIEPDLVERTGQAVCPFCGADLSQLALPASTIGDEPVETFDAGGPPPTGEVTRELVPAPTGSRIRIVESTAERLVLFIPAGGKNSGGLGCFALIWNLFMGVFTTLWIIGTVRGVKQDAPPPLLVIVPFFGLFWAIGLGMAWFWLKARFERTFLLLDRERIVVQRVLFGRKRLDETLLGTESRAALVESYQQNERPVYRVEVAGTGGAAKFGTVLSDEEKDWLVDRINEFLGVRPDDHQETDGHDDADETSSNTSPRMTTKLIVAASDETLGQGAGATDESDAVDTLVAIVESTPERLNFWYAVAPGSPVRTYGPLFLLSFSTIWLGFVGYAACNALSGPFAFSKILEGLFFLPFGAVGLAIVALALYIAFGRTTIDLTREQLACQWSIGPFSYTRRLPTDSVHSVRVVRTQNSTRDGRVKNNRTANSSGSGPYTTCVAFAGTRKLPLTFLNDESLARQVASLVNKKLREMGYRLTDA